jgi:hypothetical protein
VIRAAPETPAHCGREKEDDSMRHKLEIEFEIESKDRESAALLVNKMLDHCLLPFKTGDAVPGIRFRGYTAREKKETKKK